MSRAGLARTPLYTRDAEVGFPLPVGETARSGRPLILAFDISPMLRSQIKSEES
jgi:hypothetical protein